MDKVSDWVCKPIIKDWHVEISEIRTVCMGQLNENKPHVHLGPRGAVREGVPGRRADNGVV